MARINLIRKSNTYDSQAGSYKMLLEIVSTENVAKDLFIKQRLRNFVKNNFEDRDLALVEEIIFSIGS